MNGVEIKCFVRSASSLAIILMLSIFEIQIIFNNHWKTHFVHPSNHYNDLSVRRRNDYNKLRLNPRQGFLQQLKLSRANKVRIFRNVNMLYVHLRTTFLALISFASIEP